MIVYENINIYDYVKIKFYYLKNKKFFIYYFIF